jgi:hypothetical protein
MRRANSEAANQGGLWGSEPVGSALERSLIPDGSGGGEVYRTCDFGALQDIAPNAVTRGASGILRLLKEVALSVIHHAANDGIEIIVREKVDFASHVCLLLFDEAVIRIDFFNRLECKRGRSQ